MEKNMKMSLLREKTEYEKVMNEYDNLLGIDIGSVSVSSESLSKKDNKGLNFVNGELIIKKR